MKKLAAGVLLSLAASSVSAQQLVFPIDLECSTNSGIIEQYVKQEYQEQNFAQGKIALQSSKSGKWQMVEFKMYVNPETQTWTIIAKMPEGIDCAIGSGSDFVPWLEKTL